MRQAVTLDLAFPELRAKVARIFWVMLDQGAFALSNFLVSILFARWLSPLEYGWFSMSFSGCLLIMTLHWSVVLEPLLVQSAKIPSARQRGFVAALVRGHLVLLAGTLVVAAIGYGAGWAWRSTEIGQVVAASLLGGVCLLTLTTGRRICAIFVSTRMSAVVGLLYLVCTVGTGALLHASGPVHWLDIWLIVGGWSLVGAGATFWLSHRHGVGREPCRLADILSFAGRFAHWGLFAAICGWLQYDGLFFILAHFAGLPAVAETRAVLNIAAPLLQINMAAHVAALVAFSSAPERGSKANILALIGLYGLGALLVFPLLYEYAPLLVRLLYGGKYTDGAWQLPFYCLSLGMGTLTSIVGGVFKAHGAIVRSYVPILVAGFVSLLLGLTLIPLQRTIIYASLLTCLAGLLVSVTLRMRAEF